LTGAYSAFLFLRLTAQRSRMSHIIADPGEDLIKVKSPAPVEAFRTVRGSGPLRLRAAQELGTVPGADVDGVPAAVAIPAPT
jgi:hypothetical protein